MYPFFRTFQFDPPDMDLEESNVRAEPGPTQEEPPANQNNQTAQQTHRHVSELHSPNSTQPNGTENHTNGTSPLRRQSLSTTHAQHQNDNIETRLTQQSGREQVQSNGHAHAADTNQSRDLVLHPVQSTAAQEERLVGSMGNMTLDPQDQRRN